MLQNGLYEQVIHELLARQLDGADDRVAYTAAIDSEEAPQVLASYLAEVLLQGLQQVQEQEDGLRRQVALGNKIVSLIRQETADAGFANARIDRRARQLLALMDRKSHPHLTGNPGEVIRPETSIAASSLFTGAVHEPSLYTEFKKEILSCERIDMLVSFIKWSGLRLMMEELRQFAQRGGQLRVITTSYMGATDIKAVEELRLLPNTQVKISYDTKRTRLHAKTYAFYRDSGFSTAYVGSSNLSNAAISSGLEWNVKVTAKDLPDTMQKITATFDSYWHSAEFEAYDGTQVERLKKALTAERFVDHAGEFGYLFDIRPYPFQEEILSQLSAERSVRSQYRNLVVAATGTGKTVVSAFDYKRFRDQRKGQPARLLFVAHREEILKQSLACFRGVLRDANFGELFVGSHVPSGVDHLFMSIQTFNAQDWVQRTRADFYDYIVVDEFHHAAAPSYQQLLAHYQPHILLGLTATPERMDGQDVTAYFGNRIAAEIRLPEAIERKLLSPFQYFGVTDTVDLSAVRWARGGYDQVELSNLYTLDAYAARQRADNILSALLRYVTDLGCVIGLGFCVSIKHAHYMADHFNQHGIPSLALTGNSSEQERANAQQQLVSGALRFLFVVDLYNEGVDIPEVNTVLFLRPTESLTVFLQQLGRGLRLHEGKECLTVLDFIGQAHKRYNFEDKFAALLAHTSRSVQGEIRNGFASVPRGCYIQLERVAQQYVLDNIRTAFGRRSGLVSRIATFAEDSGKALTLANFVAHYHLDIRAIYKSAGSTFSRLCVAAGVREGFTESLEGTLAAACSRLCELDSRRLIGFLLTHWDALPYLKWEALTAIEQAMLRMFCITLWPKLSGDLSPEVLLEKLQALGNCPVLMAEMRELLAYQLDHIDFVDEPVDLGFDSPLDLHCTYTRDQLLVGLGLHHSVAVREGVKWLPDVRCDVFMVTLNKSMKHYSPTTMYKDYSINEHLFHWQSQSTTPEDSPTGRRYQTHGQGVNRMLLFVREFKNDAFGKVAPYTFLGLGSYISHEGSRPMSIIYRLHRAIPAKYMRKTNKLLVG